MNDDIAMMYGRRLPTDKAKVKLGVGVIVVDRVGHILLERRSDCGWWGLPGGGVEPGESLAQAAFREVFEETGLEVALTGLVGVYSEPTGRIVVYPDNGDERHLIDVIITARILSGSLRLSVESLELAFFPLDKMPENIVPPARLPLEDFCRGHINVLR
jgi:ADP-ribose pyrophosphatase YjhB (NUDIX family)